MADDAATVAKLRELAGAIRRAGDPRRASAEWGQIFRLLHKAGVSADRFSDLVGMRDLEGLTGLIAEIENPASFAAPERADDETCRKALEAFRKRFELMELDEQSKLGRNPLTKGVTTRISGIVPPREWPESVWQELVRQGKLRYAGRGMYDLPKT